MTTIAEPRVCQHEMVSNNTCAECGQYVMPHILQGDDVTYFDATLAEARKVIGFVMKISKTKRTLTIFVPSSGAIMELVRHVTDPKIKEAPEHRENGAWDFSARALETNRRLAELSTRITDLEEALVVNSKKK